MYLINAARVTVQDMINSTKKCTTSWGIEGYTINANGGPLPANPKYSFPKLKKDFKPTSQVTYEAYPGAPTYHKEPSWNKANGKIHDGKRVLFIEKDANFNSYKPAPNAYNPVEVRAHTKFIPFSKGQRVNFLCDAEFLGAVNPGAGKYEPSHKQTKVRSSEFKYYASKEDRTKWKPVKTALPDCALYKIEPADKHVFKQAPRNAKVMVVRLCRQTP